MFLLDFACTRFTVNVEKCLDITAFSLSPLIGNICIGSIYTVVDIQIIQPHEAEKIKIQPGRDLLTLITCHPYASGGRQRLVVYCERRE